MKARIPWKLALIPVCLLAAVALCWMTFRMLSPDAVASDVAEAASAGSPAPPQPGHASGRGDDDAPLSNEEWLARLTPRFPGMPESAPVFDDREVLAVPRRFCVISGDVDVEQRCNCYTEQGTPIRDVQASVCMEAARWGEYDPFRGPPEGTRDGPHLDTEPVLAVAPVAGITTPPVVVGSPDGAKVQGVDPNGVR